MWLLLNSIIRLVVILFVFSHSIAEGETGMKYVSADISISRTNEKVESLELSVFFVNEWKPDERSKEDGEVYFIDLINAKGKTLESIRISYSKRPILLADAPGVEMEDFRERHIRFKADKLALAE